MPHAWNRMDTKTPNRPKQIEPASITTAENKRGADNSHRYTIGTGSHSKLARTLAASVM
jgi:hypothetical protein